MQSSQNMYPRRMDDRVPRKLATACRCLLSLCHILPVYDMVYQSKLRKSWGLSLDLKFLDANTVMTPLPEQLLNVPSSAGTLCVWLGQGRLRRVSVPVQRNSQLLSGGREGLWRESLAEF